ncbi:MAG TPA: XrtA/PEP-CTERM system TPR-repeat protein PrsT [Rhizomicrobium sp.]|nr:XrtA/PEP-CTERM system TPR-repeat protein PrsT [Rhizomicrobium sp.]
MSTSRFSSGLRSRSAVAIVLASAIGCAIAPRAALAELPPSGTAAGTTDPQVARLVHDAEEAQRAGHIDLAILQLKNAVVLQPHNGTIRARLGLALLAHGEMLSAEAELRNARADGAPDGLVDPALIQVMLARNEVKALLDAFPDPSPNATDTISAQILRARGLAFANLGQYADAKNALDRALAINRATDALLARADVARAEGDAQLANKLVDEALAKRPNDVHIMLAKAELYRHHDNAKALDLINRAIAIDPKFPLSVIERAVILEDMNRTKEAMSELDSILAKAPNMPVAVYYKALFLSDAHQSHNAWMLAQMLPREFVQADPNIAISVAAIAAENGNLESAGATLSEVLTNHPQNSAARLKLAAVRIQQGAYDLAAQILDPLVEDKNPQALALMAEASLKEGHYNETLDYLERANAAAESPSEMLRRELALAEVNFGKPQQGIDDLQKLAQKNPGSVAFSGPLIGSLIRAGRLDEAKTALDRFAAAAGKSPFIGFYQAQLLMAKGDIRASVVAYDESLKIEPKFIPSLFYRAMAESSLSERPAAMRDVDAVLALDPANPLALIQKANLLAAAGQDAAAVVNLKLAIDKSPHNAIPRLALTNLQISRKQYDDAEVTIANWLQVIPNDPDALSRLGQIELFKGRKREAVATFGALADRFPRSGNAQIFLAQAQIFAGDNPGAVASAKRAVLVEPDAIRVRQSAIGIELKAGAGDTALAAAKDFQSAHPGNDADLLLTDVYFQMRRFDDAKAVLQASLSRGPDQRIIMRLAQILMLQGDTAGGIAVVKASLDKKPDDVALRRAYAGLLLQSGNSAAARNEYETVLRAVPNDTQSLNDLAWLLQDQDPNRALSLATQATKIAPASGEIADTLGWIMYHRGDTKGASTVLVHAHSASENNGEISYHLAVVLNALGRRVEAKALLQSALATGRSFSDAAAAKKLLGQW